MPLPILNVVHAPGRDDLVRLFRRTELHWIQHLGEQTQLDVGTAIANPHLPEVADANVIIDAALPPDLSPQQAVEMAEAHFAAAGSAIRRWIMNPAAPAERTGPLMDHLSAGWRRADVQVYHLAQAHVPAPPQERQLTIIPARASFRHARELAEEMTAGPTGSSNAAAGHQCVEAAMLHLDDVNYEALLALKNRRAVATVGVLTAGEIGRIDPLYVSPEHRRQGIGLTLLVRVLELCARAQFRYVFMAPPASSPETASLLRRFGFEMIGQLECFERPQE